MGWKHCGKGEIARYEQILLFQQCFQKTSTADTKNQGLFGKELKRVLKPARSNYLFVYILHDFEIHFTASD